MFCSNATTLRSSNQREENGVRWGSRRQSTPLVEQNFDQALQMCEGVRMMREG